MIRLNMNKEFEDTVPQNRKRFVHYVYATGVQVTQGQCKEFMLNMLLWGEVHMSSAMFMSLSITKYYAITLN